MGGVTLTVSDFRFGFLVLTFKIRVCVCLCVRYVTELLHYDWTGENNAASGDQAIHNRDLDWLHQSDGENQSFCWSLIMEFEPVTHVTSDLWFQWLLPRWRSRLWVLATSSVEPSIWRKKSSACLDHRQDEVSALPVSSLTRFNLVGCFVLTSCFCAVLSAMIRGATDVENFVVRDYSEDEVEKVLEQFFSSLKNWKQLFQMCIAFLTKVKPCDWSMSVKIKAISFPIEIVNVLVLLMWRDMLHVSPRIFLAEMVIMVLMVSGDSLLFFSWNCFKFKDSDLVHT